MKYPAQLFFICLFLLSAGTATAQCISGDCQNGKGTFMYPSGAKYVGEFKNGEIHGVGVCYYTDGSKYSGQWSHRFPEGKGTKTFADGEKYTGLWRKGQPINEEGEVIELFAEEEVEADDGMMIQSGCLQGDCDNGAGIFAYADGSRYEGQFVGGALQGDGVWYFPNGDRYEGSFSANYSDGTGTLFRADGSELAGLWKAGEYIGTGKIDADQEGCIEGDCFEGQGTYVYQNREAKYIGEFKDGAPNGQGSCLYANGERYVGYWTEGSFDGLGTLYLADGSAVKGFWQQGTFVGNGSGSAGELIAAAPTSETSEVLQDKAIPANIKVWAVIIGVASYSHMPVLRYTDDDAYRMFAFLKSPEGGALKDEQIRILIDEDATKERIKSTMQEVFSQAGANDLVMLYFSGHGLKGSFLPIDFDGYNNKLHHDEINAILEQSPAKYKLCIADACHSGSLFAMKGGTVESTLSNYYKSLAQAEAGTALIMSSKSGETSLESSGLRQGVFSHFLIRGLKGEADVNGNTVVSVQELFDFVAENVRAYTGMRQSPVIKGDYDEDMTVSVIRE